MSRTWMPFAPDPMTPAGAPAMWRQVPWLLAIVYLLVTGWNISQQHIENPDEPRYACAARDLVENARYDGASDWLVPRYNGEPRLKKPLLIYWALALAGKAGKAAGIDIVTAFRLVPLLCGLITVLAAYGLGRRLYRPEVGVLAALMYTGVYFAHQLNREILIDPMLTATLMSGWYFFVAGLDRVEHGEDRRAGGPFLAAYGCLGLAALAKGPHALIYGLAPMLLFVFWDRARLRSALGEDAAAPPVGGLAILTRIRFWYGLPLLLIIGTSWIWALALAGEWDAFTGVASQETIGKSDHATGLKKWPFLFYLQSLLGTLLPWSIWMLPAWWWSWRHKGGLGRGGKLLICAIGVPFVAMGLLPSKRALYMLPLFPLILIWLGAVWHAVLMAPDLEDEPKPAPQPPAFLRAFWTWGLRGLAVLLALAAWGLASGAFWGLRDWIPISQGGFIVAGVLAVFLSMQAVRAWNDLGLPRYRWHGTVSLLLMAAVAMLLLESVIRPAQERADRRAPFFTAVDLAIDRHEEAAGPVEILWWGSGGNEAVWFLHRRIHGVLPWTGLKERFFESPKAAVLIARKRVVDNQPDLAGSAKILAEIEYDAEVYCLLAPAPGKTPPEALFEKPPSRKETIAEAHKAGGLDWIEPLVLLAALIGLGVWGARSRRYSGDLEPVS